MSSDEKPLKGILKKGDGSDKKKNANVALFQVEEGHDAEKKADKPKKRIIEGKDGILVKKNDGSIESGDSIQPTGKARKSGRDHQMITKSAESSTIGGGGDDDAIVCENGDSSEPCPSQAKDTKAFDSGKKGAKDKEREEKCVIC
mmetsp:Transcript_11998/g.30377  ORF Transcript_11998/g.30377 Transcript_11998/m.30377 type:complete len:145 (-) Transcript_11998:209-643(-)|eukprot:CAMPEP_0177677170 /NCGR_PEP_ID=MMETSP0447-20121125/28226_1 /TAXON_ID=0 /ORGANISM="Stygamoeba regulata, Strain BSH-02190019" /LENGTH=144 /DNA_ID=CAMNT_0019185875 /DNA_START=42 /DNA_END=476 /DNA_ORIENTATION=-